MRSRSAVLPRELASARRRIDGWRAGNGRRRLIPEATWAEAVDLARVHGIHRVSSAMRLSYERLRERVEGVRVKTAKRDVDADPPAHFVELAPARVPDAVSVELSDGNGRCMTIRGAGHAEVLSIVAAFCGG